jgi:predicted RNA binding protein YcfA (HicA-like mRNA interferase family)
MEAIGKTKEFNEREFKYILNKNGFIFDRCKGDHWIYKRGSETVMINRKLNKMVARRLIKEHNLIFR